MNKSTERLQKKLLHYTGKAIADYKMITPGDKVLVCLSGGKDSLVMVHILHLLQMRSNNKFAFNVFILDQGLPTFNTKRLTAWLDSKQLPYALQKEDIYSIVKQKAKNNNYCMLCSRLRRGIIYSYAKKHQFNKIALGHHRNDLITSLLMSIFFQGEIATMPAKLLTNDGGNIVIRPLCYCQELDILKYALAKEFPITDKLCVGKENLTRQKIQQLINKLALENPKIPSNMLHALTRVRPSQLLDKNLWDFDF